MTYAKVYKVKSMEALHPGFTRPDSIYLVNLFNNRFSLVFAGSRKLTVTQENLAELGEYSLLDFDSSFKIVKESFCDKKNKLSFQSYPITKTKKDTIINGFVSIEAIALNQLGDTTRFYLTKALPKAAGIAAIKNLSECVIGFESKIMRIFPSGTVVTYSEPYAFNIGPGIESKIKSQDVWMDGHPGELEETKNLPSVMGMDINRKPVTNASLDKNENSVIIILNSIKGCEGSDPRFAKYLLSQTEQNAELLNAASSLAKEKNVAFYVLTDDYYEDIDQNTYPLLHIIPNATTWKEKMQVFQTPLILIVRSNKIVAKLSPFDFGEDDFFDGLKKRLVN